MNDPCSCKMFEPEECSACEPRVAAVPLSLVNRPGLSALRYRVGTFSTFRQAMLDALIASPVESVDPADPSRKQRLTSRSSDDFAVSMLELWAYICDVLTFYQQSIINEAFVRTAILRESVARLADLIGYEPARGVAATVLLAFFADKGAAVTLPDGLKMQTVPPPGQGPVIFETSGSLDINVAANQPALLGTLQSTTFNSSGELKDGAGNPAVVPGSKLVFFNSTTKSVAEQVVTSVTPNSLGGKVVEWSGNLGGLPATTPVARFNRKFKYFGANAPASYLKGEPDPSDSTKIKWTNVSMESDGTETDASKSFYVAGSSTIYLDGIYDGLVQGGRLLLHYHVPQGSDASWVQVYTMQSVGQGSSSRGLISGSCTAVTLDSNIDAINDLRSLTIYELLGVDLQFRTQANPDSIAAGASTLYVADASAIHKNTMMMLVSGGKSDVVTATAEPTVLSDGSASVAVTPPLKNAYKPSETDLYANVTSATQGETQKEIILGNGDASLTWQEFTISPNPVTYVPDPAADRGAGSTLRVFVDDFEWTEVESFYGRGSEETIFTTRIDDQGKMHVRFGDGQTGRRLPTGNRNVRAQLRKGMGASGNVDPGTVRILLQPFAGLKSVTNPLAAYGGSDPESLDAMRQTAPGSVVTLGRAVSLRDYEALALSYSGVEKARASWADFGDRRGVALTVAAAGGKPLGELAQPLHEFLDDHRDPNVPLNISDFSKVHFIFRATLHLMDGYKQSVVKAAAEAALGPKSDAGYLSFASLNFGQNIFQSAVISVLQKVTGVDWVELRELSVPASAAGHGFGDDPSRLEAVVIDATEIAWATLDDSDDQAAVNLQYQDGVNDLEGL